MYILSLLSFGNFIIFLLLCIYATKLSSEKSELNRYTFLVCLSLGIWNLFYSFFYGAANKETAWILYKIAAIGMYSFPVFTLKFFLVLTKREKMLSSVMGNILLYLPPTALIFYVLFSKTTPLADDLALSSIGLGWTYVNRADKWSFWLTALFLMLYLVTGLYILYRWGRESKYQMEKKQARLFLVADCIVLTAGVVTDFILPLYGNEIPPMANVFTIIFTAFLYYIIKELQVFNINKITSSEVIINTLLEPVLVLDNHDIIVQANTAAEQMFGFLPEFFQGKTLSEVLVDNHEVEEKNDGETTILNTPGGAIDVMFSKNEVRDQWNGYMGTVIHFKDITEMKQEEKNLRIINRKYTKAAEKLEQIAHYDTLTGIPNRRMFFKTLSDRLKYSEKREDDFGLIFMDLNGFKSINDDFGHNIGDQVLVETVLRLKSITKTNDSIVRLGGDEFVMLVNFEKKEEIYLKSNMIQTTIAEPFYIEGLTLQISVAVGISIYSENMTNMKDMIHAADLAMYKHKKHQKS